MNPIHRWLRQLDPRALLRRAALFVARPAEGEIDFGDLGRLTPISDNWGFDRGTPVDRHYVEQFLAEHEEDVRGHVLEVGDDRYTRQFGGTRIASSDVLHVKGGRGVTMVGDLTRPDDFEPNRFDCVLLVQTLQFVDDPEAVVRSVHRLLTPGGVALATFSGITRVSPHDVERWGHYYNLTRFSAERLFEGVFGTDRVEVETAGNVFTATAFLYGIAAEELPEEALSRHDPDFGVLILVRAEKER